MPLSLATYIRNDVITKHYHQLMPLSLATVFKIYLSSGFARKEGNITNPRRRLRLCPRANKNLHIPAGYAQSILMHNLCKFLIAYGLCSGHSSGIFFEN
ncbi:hypothetical protein T07_5042 [Trichinella nelsoni]|uniref:Uncharacterized protein n=1 Tax=Trichinella nelsoni TaxID=6336 RepID=A0A0V0S7W2_9BILA|nr:hypothetical protein T07_5042 [Trichinella nelsoni]